MMRFLYDLSIGVLVLSIRTASLFNAKARLWIQGREDWRKRYAAHLANIIPQKTSPKPKILWVHAASLGEFEQGRPVIEAFREQYPDWKIVLTFFSPSGYEIRKNYPFADLVCYLPADTQRNAKDFIEIVQPDVAIFIKYEFWANHLFELKKRGVPTLLVSGLFRPSQPFFQWYGAFWRKILGCFSHFFLQNASSGDLLQSVGFQNFTLAGDTRVDRVVTLAESQPEVPIVSDFVSNAPHVLIAGSTWPEDEAMILDAMALPEHIAPSGAWWKLIIAPHEPSEVNVQRVCDKAHNAQRYSQQLKHPDSQPDAVCLIIDNVGLLNTLYRFGTVAYIGGGFGKGIHNTLEPAAFGLPIIFGPKYDKFEEARQFVARGGAFPVNNAEALAATLEKLQDPAFYKKASEAVRTYLEESRGATAAVMGYLNG